VLAEDEAFAPARKGPPRVWPADPARGDRGARRPCARRRVYAAAHGARREGADRTRMTWGKRPACHVGRASRLLCGASVPLAMATGTVAPLHGQARHRADLPLADLRRLMVTRPSGPGAWGHVGQASRLPCGASVPLAMATGTVAPQLLLGPGAFEGIDAAAARARRRRIRRLAEGQELRPFEVHARPLRHCRQRPRRVGLRAGRCR